MKLFPDSCLTDLEFDKLLNVLKTEANSQSTITRIIGQSFEESRANILDALYLVADYVKAMDAGQLGAMGEFEGIEEALTKVRPTNFVLALGEIFSIYRILEIHDSFSIILSKKENADSFEHLKGLVLSTESASEVLKALKAVITDSGEMRDDASPELTRIRAAKEKMLVRINKTFDRVIRDLKSDNVLIDSEESFKGGRRVLAVKAERKRQIRGIVLDQSASGQTAYIEPEEIVLLNNELFDLENEEKKEIHRILLSICDLIRSYREDISKIEELVIELDFIRVKAVLARRLDGEIPEIIDGPSVHWVQARHPLLKLKNDPLKKETVPSDIILHGNNQYLVISGPNAGGKSIALKTLGLLQLMLQYGMMVPVDATSKAGIFGQLMVDIGDQQSIENDLSTYSSRLQKMVGMMNSADERTLVLLDEFGSGTDPKTGGALAESILRHLMYQKSWGAVTTHYSNLKVFAFKNKGVVNACMEFDTETITPTYRLTIGKPGSSFAFEIAANMKVPEIVLKNAKRRLGEKQVAVEDLLVTIQAQKKELEDKISQLDAQQQKLDKLIKQYERLSGDLDYKRKKLKLQTKEQRANLEAEFNRQLENTIRDIQESRNLEKAKAIASQKREERQELSKELSELQSEIIDLEKDEAQEIKVGSFVKMNNGSVAGEVIEMIDDKAKVNFGLMMMEVPVMDLRTVGAPLTVNKKKSIQTDIFEKTAQFKPRLDIRGLKMEEALQIMQDYFDEAVVIGADRLEIIHGKGSGVLRKVVRDKAREYSQISKISHPKPEDGGEGISIVTFN